MDRPSHQVGQETPKWPNKNLPPVCLCTCIPGLLLSPKSSLMGSRRSPRREATIRLPSLLGGCGVFARSTLPRKGHWSHQGSNWKLQDRSPAVAPPPHPPGLNLEFPPRRTCAIASGTSLSSSTSRPWSLRSTGLNKGLILSRLQRLPHSSQGNFCPL